MVGVLIRMKFRVLRHSLRGGQAVGIAVGAVLGLLGAVATVLACGVRPAEPSVAVDLVAALMLLWTVGWLFGPVFTGGGDETLRPEHFTLLPIRPAALAAGLLGAAFVGVPALVSLIAFTGLVAFASGYGGAAVAVAVPAVAVQLVFVVLLSRLVIAVLGAALRSRRGRDLGVLLAALVGLSGFGIQYVFAGLGPRILTGDSPVVSSILRGLPSGWTAVAVAAAGRNDWLLAVGALAGLAVLVAGLLAGWAALLMRRMTTTPATVPTRQVSGPAGAGRGLLPATPVGAVAGKELRTWWRDARRRAALLSTLIVGLVIALGSAFGGGALGGLAFAGATVVAFGCLQAGNLYGFDGSSLWHTLVVPGAERVDVRGRQLAWLLIVGPVALVLAVLMPGISGSAWTYPWVLGLVPALLGGGAGLIVLLSVFAAYRMPDQRSNNPFAAGGNPGCLRGLLQLAMGLLLAVAAAPVVLVLVLGALTGSAVLSWLAVPVGIGTGVLLGWWWGRLAVRRLTDRGPELLALVGKAG